MTVDLYKAFRSREPDGRAGYSIYLYNLTYPSATEVVRPVVLGEPLWQVAPEELGIAPETRAAARSVETPESTVFPLGAGFHGMEDDAFQREGADFDDVLMLRGYTQESAPLQLGGILDLTLYWQVGEQQMPQPAPTRGAPISTFVQVVDGDPANKVAEFDSWHVALRGLEPSDIIAQHAILQLSESAVPKFYDLIVGLFPLQNGQRLTTAQAGVQRNYAVAGSVEVTATTP